MDYQVITMHRNLIYTTFKNLYDVVQSHAKNFPPLEVLEGDRIDAVFNAKRMSIIGTKYYLSKILVY